MALHASGLPSIAAATSELWPSIAKSLAVLSPATQQTRVSAVPVSNSTSSTTKLPGFMRNAPLAKLAFETSSQANVSPTNILSVLSNMTPNSIARANPLIRSSHAALMARRPLGTIPGLRFMSTTRPPIRMQPLTWPALKSLPSLPPRNIQYRSFGNSNLVPHHLLARTEAAANRNPQSAPVQASFYQLLIKANMPAIVVERYQSGRFAANESATEAYNQALAMINGTAGIAGQASSALNDQVNAAGQAIAAHRNGGNIAVSANGSAGKGGALHVIVDESFGSTAFRWFKFTLWFSLCAYVSLVVMTMVVETVSSLKRPGAKVDTMEAKAENQKARFSDVHGCDEAKEELQELVDFLRNPDKFNTLGGKLPKGVLLVGPPGTGKTLLARAVAGEAGVPFFFMSGSEFDEIYVGVGAKRVRELFNAAKAKSPSIVFIDELDAIGGKRNSRDATYVRQTLNQLLTEMDGFSQNSGVIVIAATNFPESLDKALTRPGRFDRHVVVSLPDVRGRIAILKHHAKKIKMAPDVRMEDIAGRTSGLSGAELENIVNQAAIHASKLKNKVVTQKDMEWAKDKVIMGAEKRSMVITPKEKEMTAYHEAGHALVAFFNKQEGGSHLYKVTVLPRGQSLGHTAFLPEMDKYSYTVRDYLAIIDRALGGKVAEEIVYGSEFVTGGVSSDLDSATRTAWHMVAQLGMSPKLGPVEYLRKYNELSSETRAMVESEVKKVLDESYERARTLLLSKRKELDLLAKALVEYETLDHDEVVKVLRGEKLTDRIAVPIGPMTVPKPNDSFEPGLPLPGLGDDDGGGSGGPPPPAPPPASARTSSEEK